MGKLTISTAVAIFLEVFCMFTRPGTYLVGGIPTPLKNMSQLGWWHSQYMESHSKFHGSSHHQPVIKKSLTIMNHSPSLTTILLVYPIMMFQSPPTTNQNPQNVSPKMGQPPHHGPSGWPSGTHQLQQTKVAAAPDDGERLRTQTSKKWEPCWILVVYYGQRKNNYG